MSIIKKMVIILSSVFILLNFTAVAYASPVEGINVEKDSTKGIAPCPNHGYHQMKNTGKWVIVYYNGNAILSYAAEFKCDCGETIVCSGYPQVQGGYVGSFFYGDDLYNYQNLGMWVSYDSYRSTPRYSSSSLPGYTF